MQSLSLRPTETENSPLDLASEIMRLETILAARKSELVSLQEELRLFRTRYTQIVGSCLTELADIERAIKKAEARLFGVEDMPEEDDTSSHDDEAHRATSLPVKAALRKLFWSVAKVFHPDHAADEKEAQRRHTIMAEASRAYTEGDIESLHTLLGDEHLQSYCANGGGAPGEDEEENPANRLLGLKDELRTVEFGIKRIEQDSLYQLKLSCDVEAAQQRDALAAMVERLERQIVKARHRLEHVS